MWPSNLQPTIPTWDELDHLSESLRQRLADLPELPGSEFCIICRRRIAPARHAVCPFCVDQKNWDLTRGLLTPRP